MLQELYDNYLIRTKFSGMTADEIIEQIESEEEFSRYCYCIVKIMNEDNFILADPDIIYKIREFINAYRFKYKESTMQVNYILIALNDYDALEETEKMNVEALWVEGQVKDRFLSKKFDLLTPKDIQQLIQADYVLLNNTREVLKNRDIIKKAWGNQLCIYSTVNLFYQRYSEFIEENPEIAEVWFELCKNTVRGNLFNPNALKNKETKKKAFENLNITLANRKPEKQKHITF